MAVVVCAYGGDWGRDGKGTKASGGGTYTCDRVHLCVGVVEREKGGGTFATLATSVPGSQINSYLSA